MKKSIIMILSIFVIGIMSGCSSENSKIEDAIESKLSKTEQVDFFTVVKEEVVNSKWNYSPNKQGKEMVSHLRDRYQCLKESNEQKFNSLKENGYMKYAQGLKDNNDKYYKNKTFKAAMDKFDKDSRVKGKFKEAYNTLISETGDDMSILFKYIFDNTKDVKTLDEFNRYFKVLGYNLTKVKYFNDNMPEESLKCNNHGLEKHTSIIDIKQNSQIKTFYTFKVKYSEEENGIVKEGDVNKKDGKFVVKINW